LGDDICLHWRAFADYSRPEVLTFLQKQLAISVRAAEILLPQDENPVGRTRHRWEENIRTDVREVGWEVVNWIHVGQDRHQWRTLFDTVMNLRFP
jgi:hypothetical protein